MNRFKSLIQVLNSKPSGKHFTRNELGLMGLNMHRMGSTHQTYFLMLRHAGYFKTVKPGLYKKLRKIPSSLTLSQLQKLAYPKRKRQ